MFFSCSLQPGSFPYAEKYEIDTSYSVLIDRINSFKENNPKYKVPDEVGLSDGQFKHWYIVYFYLPEENEILYTWVRKYTKTKTTFAFVKINKGLNLGNWKRINKDYDEVENQKHKKKFENLILKKII